MADSVVGVLRVLLTANSAEFEAAMKKAADSAKAWSNDLKQVGTQMSTVGAALTKAITLPLAGIGIASAKAAMDFESSFAGVKKTVDATDAEFAQMAQSFRNLAKEIPVNVNELNRLAEAAGAMDIPKESIVDFTRVMALLGVTTNVTSEQAAESIGKIQNIFGAAGVDTDRFAATLVALGNNGAATEDQILSMATRIAGAGNQVGLTQGQVLAFGNALSSVGLEAESGGTAISRTFLTINDAVMGGGKALDEFARVAGMSAADFKQAFETDAAGATTAFISGLARVKGEGENVNKVLGGLELGEIRVRDALMRASGAGDLLTKSLNLQATAWRENTALTNEAAERFKTTESQLKLLWTRVGDVGITLGNALLPAIRSTITLLGDLVPIIDAAAKGFAALPPSVQMVVVGMGAAVAAAGPLLWISGQLITSAAAVTGAFATKGIAARALGTALTAVTVPVALVGAAIGSLAVVWASFKNDWTRAFDVLIPPIGLFRTAIDRASDAIEPYKQQVADVATIIKSSFVIATELANRALDSLREQVLPPLIAKFNEVKEAVTSAAGVFTRLLLPAIQPYVSSVGLLVYLNERLQGSSDSAKDALSKFAADMKKASDAIQAGTVQTKANTEAVDTGVQVYARAAGPIQAAGAATQAYSQALIAARKEVAGLSSEQRAAIVAGDELGDSTKEIAESMGISEGAVKLYKAQLEGLVNAEKENIDVQERAQKWLEESKKKLEEEAEALEKANLMLMKGVGIWGDYGAEVEKATKRIGESIISNALIAKTAQDATDLRVRKQTMSRLEFELDAIQRKAANEKLAIDQSVAGWERAAAAIDRVADDAMNDLVLSTDEVTAALASMAMMFPQLSGFLAEFSSAAETTGSSIQRSLGTQIRDGVGKALAGLSSLMQSAFTGGGGLLGAMKAFGVQLAEAILEPLLTSINAGRQRVGAAAAGLVSGVSAAIQGGSWQSQMAQVGLAATAIAGTVLAAAGATTAGITAAAVGSAAALGAMTLGIGAAAVGVGLLIRHFTGVSSEIKDARVYVDKFQEAIAATLTPTQLAEAGGERWKMTVIGVRDAYIATGRSAADAEAIVKQLWDTDHPARAHAAMLLINEAMVEYHALLADRSEATALFDELIAAADEMRGALPDSLQPMIDKMVELGLLTADQATQFAALSGDAEVDFERMEADAQKYGISLGDLGPKFRGAKLGATAEELWGAFDRLTRQGASVGGVLFGMRDEMSQFVNESIRAGRDIPENFRPLIEELQRSGNLFDDNRLKAMAWGEETLEKGREIPEGLRGVIRTFMDTGDLIDAASGKTLTLDDLMATYGRDGSESVRDVIRQLVEQDTKIGDNNGALTDLSQVKFGDPIVRAIDTIVTRFEEFLTRISETETRLSHGVPQSARHAAEGLEDMSRRGIAATEELGAAIRDNVIEMHSPTGLEGIAVYAGLAADAMSNMARTGGAAMRSVSSAVAGVATAMTRISTSNIGKQLAGLMGNMRGLDMQDFSGLLSGFKGMGDKLVDKFYSLFREVRIGMAEGFGKELQKLQFNMQDEVNALGPDPATYRANWGLARETLQQQLRYQLEDLEEARRDQILSLGPLPDAYEQYYNKAIGKAEKAYQKQLRSLEESKRRELANLDDVVEYYGGSYEEAERAVRDEHAAMLQDAIERYEEEIEQLGPIPAEYAQIYEKAFDQVNVYYDRMEARAEEKSQRELELLGPIPDEYESLFGQALELVKSKYKSMVEEAAKAAKETVDAWKIVAEMFSTLTAANPNLMPSAAAPGPAPAYGVTSGGWVVSQGEDESKAAPPVYGVTSGGWIVSQGGIPHLAMGGIVSAPTLAMIGEGGPEAVVPLDRVPGGNDLAAEFRQFRSEAATDRALAARDRAQLPHLIGVAVNARAAGRR